MVAIDKYKAQVALQYEAKRWAGMLGKKYTGGGGGTGELLSFKSLKAVLYYQESDGSKNYHEAPDALLAAIDAEIKHNFPVILESALMAIEGRRMELAREAAKEHADLMQAAGLTP